MTPRRMKYCLIAAILFMQPLPQIATAEAVDILDKVLDMPPGGRVYLSNTAGNIDIKTWRRENIRINARVPDSNKDVSDNISVNIKQTENAIWIKTTVKSEHAPAHASMYPVHFQIHMPENASLKVKSGGGDTLIHGVKGAVDVRNIHGSNTISAVAGNVNCELIDGDVTLAQITGDIRMRSVSGKITVNGVDGSVRIDSVSGDVVLEALSHLHDAEMKTITGAIHISGKPPNNAVYEIKSFDGHITMDIFDDASFALQAKTMKGIVTSGFSPKARPEDLLRRLKLSVGDGAASLYLSSFKGNIAINEVKP